MMEKRIEEVYVAVDGSKFTNMEECLVYEDRLLESRETKELLSLVDDFVKLSFYYKKVGGKYSLRLDSLSLSNGESYTPNSGNAYQKLKEALEERGVYLNFCENYAQFVDAYFQIKVTDEKYEELLNGTKG